MEKYCPRSFLCIRTAKGTDQNPAFNSPTSAAICQSIFVTYNLKLSFWNSLLLLARFLWMQSISLVMFCRGTLKSLNLNDVVFTKNRSYYRLKDENTHYTVSFSDTPKTLNYHYHFATDYPWKLLKQVSQTQKCSVFVLTRTVFFSAVKVQFSWFILDLLSVRFLRVNNFFQ